MPAKLVLAIARPSVDAALLQPDHVQFCSAKTPETDNLHCALNSIAILSGTRQSVQTE